MNNLELFGQFVEVMSDGLVIVDRAGRIVHVNRQAEELSGYSRSELVGKPIEMLVPDALVPVHHAHRERYHRGTAVARGMGSGLEISLKRKSGEELPVDIALSPLATEEGGLVAATIRDIAERRRTQDSVRAVLEASQAIVRGESPDTVLGMIARQARSLAHAAVAALVVPGDDPQVLAVQAADGATDLVGPFLPATGSPAGESMGTASAVIVAGGAGRRRSRKGGRDAAPTGPAMAIPLVAADRVIGVLLVVNQPHGEGFNEQDLALIQPVAAQAVLAIEYSRAQDELHRMAVIEDRERIGRDLHDGAIQKLFAVGMSLQGAALRMPEDDLKRRLDTAVNHLDEVIRDLRNYIFGLRPNLLADRHLEESLRHSAEDFAQRSGVVAAVEVDARLAAELSGAASELLPIAAEALSNVGRHAEAATCRVTLRRDGAWAVLEVEDDGRGFDPENLSDGGQGLRNFRERAAVLGGEAQVESAPKRGTTVTVRFPLSR